MSASLVGSEMCIRDRLRIGLRELSRSPFVIIVRTEREYDNESLPGARAVSYTHLTLPTICSV
eukprot:9087983-Alexandrium_andersonii.AAC.1